MTNAVPFGVYIAPTSIIRADVRERISNGEWCYIQLLKRSSYQSYTIYAASSLTDLRCISLNEADNSIAIDRVFVTTISRQDLHMQCGLFSAPRAESPIYVAPDCVLKSKCSEDGEELQLVASSAWLCYFRVLQVFADGSVSIRVAALPHRAVAGRYGRSYFTTLSRDEFALALALERKDLDLTTGDLRENVEEKAYSILGKPVEHIHPAVPLDDEDQEEVPAPKLAYPPEVLKMLRPLSICTARRDQPVDEEELQVQQPKTKALKPIFVPEIIAQQAVDRFKEATGKVPTSRKQRQKVWLQAALLALRSYKKQAQQHVTDAIDQQDRRIRDVLVNWLCGAVQLVEAIPVIKKSQKRRIQGYVVRIEQPSRL